MKLLKGFMGKTSLDLCLEDQVKIRETWRGRCKQEQEWLCVWINESKEWWKATWGLPDWGGLRSLSKQESVKPLSVGRVLAFSLLFSQQAMSSSLRPQGLWPSRLLCPRDFPSKNTGVGCHFLLQGIFLTQGLNLGLLNVSWAAGKFFYHWVTGEAWQSVTGPEWLESAFPDVCIHNFVLGN